jgi:hypothetical protein
MGTIQNIPGLLKLWNFPKRRTTAFSHWGATFTAMRMYKANKIIIPGISTEWFGKFRSHP